MLLAWGVEDLDTYDEIVRSSELLDRGGLDGLRSDEADELERNWAGRLGMQLAEGVGEDERAWPGGRQEQTRGRQHLSGHVRVRERQAAGEGEDGGRPVGGRGTSSGGSSGGASKRRGYVQVRVAREERHESVRHGEQACWVMGVG